MVVVDVLEEVVEELVPRGTDVVVVDGFFRAAAVIFPGPQAARVRPATASNIGPSNLRPDNFLMGASR